MSLRLSVNVAAPSGFGVPPRGATHGNQDGDNGWRSPTMKKLQQFHSSMLRVSSEIDLAEESIIDHITCPECHNFIRPPAHCCENGHFVCHCCKRGECPVCGSSSYPNKENAVFDMLLRDIFFPCPFQDNGCAAMFKWDDLAVHQVECQFQMSPCAFHASGCRAQLRPGEKGPHEEKCDYGVVCRVFSRIRDADARRCDWRGDRRDLRDHVLRSHRTGFSPFEIDSESPLSWILPIDFNFEKTELLILKDLNQMFYFYAKSVGAAKHYIAVQYIGDRERARDYKYSVEFTYDSQTLRYEDVVLPYDLALDEVYESSNCFDVVYDFLKKHFLAERIIDCYIRVYRREDPDGSVNGHDSDPQNR